ncbi:MAG TPA: NosD domain-containing protein [Rubrobacter sp.]|nr:NosD domain-containing protein [Rubrobacter sp.]
MSIRVAVTVALLLTMFVAAHPVHSAPTTFTVNSTGDENDLDYPDGTFDDSSDGKCDSDASATGDQCTLRAAIQEANTTTDADTISFNITTGCDATSGVCTINVGSSTAASGEPLPEIIQQVTIDGYTQGDATATTDDDATVNEISLARDGTNAKLLIELNGANVTDQLSPHNGLEIKASDVVVKGLVINRFGGTGIFIVSGGSGAEIGGNFIGTDPTGTQGLGNVSGVGVFGDGANIIGGREAAAHNLISGNFHGLTISSNTGNTIQGNLIGTNGDGTSTPNNLGNVVEGVSIGSSNNIVGSAAGDNDLDSNLIAFNGDEGIRIGGGTGNRILNNRIHSNGKLGINMMGGTEDTNGVTRNDGRAKDRDTGANNLQNFPALSYASTVGGTTTIKGTLRSSPRKTFIIQIFSSPAKDPSGFGEGQEYIGERRVTTDRDGRGSFTFRTGAITRMFVTTTATRLAPDPNNPTTLIPRDTSEFSAAKKVTLAR